MAQLNIRRGDYHQFQMTLKKDGALIDLTGKTVWFTVKTAEPSDPNADLDDASALVKAYWVSGGSNNLLTVSDPTTGVLTLTLDSDLTTTLPISQQPCRYDVQVKLGTKKLRTWDSGQFVVSTDLTRRTTTP